MRHPLSLTLCALLADVTGGYQHARSGLRPVLCATASPWPATCVPVGPSRTVGASMWMPIWRAPAVVQTQTPRRERRCHISLWLLTSIRSVAGFPVRVSMAAARVMRSACLYLRRPWSDHYDTNIRSLPGSRGSAADLMPSPAERRKREKLIKNIARLDAEGAWRDLAKELFTDPTKLVADPTQLSAWQGKVERTIERKVVDRSPLLEWSLKHHSPAGPLSESLLIGGSMLERVQAFVRALQVPPTRAHIAEKRRQLAAKRREVAMGIRTIEANVKPAIDTHATSSKTSGKLSGVRPHKGKELKKALRPIVRVEYQNIFKAARRHPAAAPALLWRSMRTGTTLALWRVSAMTGVGDRRSLMDALLCQIGLTVATCRAVIDPDACTEGSECRAYLDDSCVLPDEY
mmetsp:Transcript_6040/g.11973  ORF Transcript_6040/g.11973 Transcript_6040/m.11973 type:complete len:404 (+) Transcript_6040:83-1294(+)|eukprot:CAMPEP_0119069472 /NCGR_PEP_ID=MMETSP1178-20130426/19583_1 /TAXON_ID=33656 /ORGANISM="unid sp, Strain CCMP2000" /LENGTH=403 /DNA_ID=CAMNT_0007051239 /DNA_START=90 /DNA_END=1301 /DNA_ORIENTATION=+